MDLRALWARLSADGREAANRMAGRRTSKAETGRWAGLPSPSRPEIDTLRPQSEGPATNAVQAAERAERELAEPHSSGKSTSLHRDNNMSPENPKAWRPQRNAEESAAFRHALAACFTARRRWGK